MKSLSFKTFLVIVLLVILSLGVITYNNTQYLEGILKDNFRDSAMSALERKGLVLEGNLSRFEREMPEVISSYYDDKKVKGEPNLENLMANSDVDISQFQIVAQKANTLKTLSYINKSAVETKKRAFKKANIEAIRKHIRNKNSSRYIFQVNKGDPNFISFARSYKLDEKNIKLWVVIGLQKKSLDSYVKTSKDSRSFVFDENLHSIAHSQKQKPVAFKKQAVRKLIESDAGSGFAGRSTDFSGISWYTAYYHSAVYGFILVLEQDTSILLNFTHKMAYQSLWWSAFILLLAVFVAFYASQGLVKNLNNLTNATRMIASGHFAEPIQVKSKDEIGVLAQSVRWMAQKIQVLLESEKEKVRFEQEIATANTVQNTFFTDEKSENENLRISGFYTPASECGGDWWGSFTISPGVELVLIGDATGHGVPAALITAMTYAVSNVMVKKMIGKSYEDIKPSEILYEINETLYGALAGQLCMTFFALLLDTKQDRMKYANGGHCFPLLVPTREHDERLKKKKKWQPIALSHKRGMTTSILGIQADVEYHDQEMSFLPGDKVVLYTDGFTESRGNNGKQWGTRGLIKAIKPFMHSNSEAIKGEIIKAVHEFYPHTVYEDDLTLVVVEYKEGAASNSSDESRAEVEPQALDLNLEL